MLHVFPRSLPSPPNLAHTTTRVFMGGKLGGFGGLCSRTSHRTIQKAKKHEKKPQSPEQAGVSFKQHFARVVAILGKIYNIYDLAGPQGFQACFSSGVLIAVPPAAGGNRSQGVIIQIFPGERQQEQHKSFL